MGEFFFLKYPHRGIFFFKIWGVFIGMNIPRKSILYTPESDLNGKEFASIMCACMAHVKGQGERCADWLKSSSWKLWALDQLDFCIIFADCWDLRASKLMSIYLRNFWSNACIFWNWDFEILKDTIFSARVSDPIQRMAINFISLYHFKGPVMPV